MGIYWSEAALRALRAGEDEETIELEVVRQLSMAPLGLLERVLLPRLGLVANYDENDVYRIDVAVAPEARVQLDAEMEIVSP